jgi:hypothetical protein
MTYDARATVIPSTPSESFPKLSPDSSVSIVLAMNPVVPVVALTPVVPVVSLTPVVPVVNLIPVVAVVATKPVVATPRLSQKLRM